MVFTNQYQPRVRPHSFNVTGMIFKSKLGRGQTKSVLVARLRLGPMQIAFKILSIGLAKKAPSLCRKSLKTRRFPALSLLDLKPFSCQPVMQNE